MRHRTFHDCLVVSAEGARLYQPGATPQDEEVHIRKGLKARFILAYGAGFQPSLAGDRLDPGALPQAGMGRALGPWRYKPASGYVGNGPELSCCSLTELSNAVPLHHVVWQQLLLSSCHS